MQRLTDYDIYKELITLADRLDAMADKSLSLRSRSALKTASEMCRKLASAFFKASF
jgi:hypothetical protein